MLLWGPRCYGPGARCTPRMIDGLVTCVASTWVPMDSCCSSRIVAGVQTLPSCWCWWCHHESTAEFGTPSSPHPHPAISFLFFCGVISTTPHAPAGKWGVWNHYYCILPLLAVQSSVCYQCVLPHVPGYPDVLCCPAIIVQAETRARPSGLRPHSPRCHAWRANPRSFSSIPILFVSMHATRRSESGIEPNEEGFW